MSPSARNALRGKGEASAKTAEPPNGRRRTVWRAIFFGLAIGLLIAGVQQAVADVRLIRSLLWD